MRPLLPQGCDFCPGAIVRCVKIDETSDPIAGPSRNVRQLFTGDRMPDEYWSIQVQSINGPDYVF
jgi:hypothetical protein